MSGELIQIINKRYSKGESLKTIEKDLIANGNDKKEVKKNIGNSDAHKFYSSYQAMYFLGGLNLFVGILSLLGIMFDVESGIFSVILGAIFFVLGYFTYKRIVSS